MIVLWKTEAVLEANPKKIMKTELNKRRKLLIKEEKRKKEVLGIALMKQAVAFHTILAISNQTEVITKIILKMILLLKQMKN